MHFSIESLPEILFYRRYVICFLRVISGALVFYHGPSFPQFLTSPLHSKRSKIIPKSYHGLVWCSDIFVLYIGTAQNEVVELDIGEGFQFFFRTQFFLIHL